MRCNLERLKEWLVGFEVWLQRAYRLDLAALLTIREVLILTQRRGPDHARYQCGEMRGHVRKDIRRGTTLAMPSGWGGGFVYVDTVPDGCVTLRSYPPPLSPLEFSC